MEGVYIYVLKLQNSKYYIGATVSVIKRLSQHQNGTGAAWTKLYPVVDIIEVIPNQSPFDEDKYVKIYMAKYGIENVRGGSYSLPTLNKAEMDVLIKEIYGSSGRCFRCGNTGHFVKDCTMNNSSNKIENKYNYNNPNDGYIITADLNSQIVGGVSSISYSDINNGQISNDNINDKVSQVPDININNFKPHCIKNVFNNLYSICLRESRFGTFWLVDYKLNIITYFDAVNVIVENKDYIDPLDFDNMFRKKKGAIYVYKDENYALYTKNTREYIINLENEIHNMIYQNNSIS